MSKYYWMVEAPHELGYKIGTWYWLGGYGWMKLERIERVLLNPNVSVTYHFSGEGGVRKV